MPGKTARLCLSMVLILLVGLTAAATCAVAQAAGENMPTTQTITGCLQKGLESGGFFVISSNNKHWEVYNAGNVPLADHVGQTVTLTGTFPHRTAAQEEKSQPYEKKETGTRQHADFQVTSLQVVSPTCGK
ncbi:MAG TPA: hypothetical protein VL240_10110 [Candidatus Binatia bacterium]|nr:hypothetical protein [Candidatus Binatia bacterium]